MGPTLRITSRSGGSAVEVSWYDFFQLPDIPTYNGDASIHFDLTHQRWIALESSWDCVPGAPYGYTDLAISDSADPLGSWHAFSRTTPGYVLRSPRLGLSSTLLAMSGQIQGMPPCGPDIVGGGNGMLLVLDWASLLAGGSSLPLKTYPPNGFQVFLPSVQQPATSPTLHLIEQHPVVGSNVFYSRLTGSVAGGTIALSEAVDLTAAGVVEAFGWPWEAKQPDGEPVQSLVAGPRDFVWHEGRLAWAQWSICQFPTPVSCVRVTELQTSSATPSLTQDFVVGEETRSSFAGGIGFALDGTLHVLWNGSSPAAGDFISGYAGRQPAGTTNGLIGVRRLNQGTATYLDAWQPGTGVALDPQDSPVAWHASPFATGASTFGSDVGTLGAATGDTYVPITPLRVLDTRTATGLTGAFQNNIPRTFNVAGIGAIPANAVAITGNVTVAGQGSAGYVSVGPSITANPTSSTINFPLGDNRANNLTLPLNAGGDLMAIFKGAPTKATQLILDVTGYFLPDETGATYQPITAARVLDSRYGTGLSGTFVANTPRTFQVTGVGGVPAGATAVTGNLTVVGQSKAGYVSLTPTPEPNPLTSTINFPVGDARANGLTVRLSGTGSLSAVFKASGGSTDLIFDVTGYYVDGLTGLRFYPLNPGRIMDSRFNTLTQLFGPFTSSTPRTLVTGGHFGVPGDALAVTGNLTVVGQTKAGYVSITKTPDATPLVSTINFPLGDVRANGITVPLNTVNDMALVYKANPGAKTHLILDLTGYFK
jgi:hypothetical protein